MAGKVQELKGKVEEATGHAVGSDHLEKKGKADKEVGKAKQQVEKARDAVREEEKAGDRGCGCG